jgi:hypothetical protein
LVDNILLKANYTHVALANKARRRQKLRKIRSMAVIGTRDAVASTPFELI